MAMQFTDEVNWDLADFVVAGILLLSTGLTGEFILKNVAQIKYRIAILTALFFVLIIIWVELAVGIFGSPFSGH